MENGAKLIARERKEQQEKHGFSRVRDLDYKNDELLDMAVQYIGGDHVSCWPEGIDKRYYKPGNRVKELVRAGALIAAEIDRLLLEDALSNQM